MKKFLVVLVLAASIFMIFNQNIISWVGSNFSSSPTPYYQQRSEFFEKLSREYYGVPDYGNELAAVNRSFVIAEISTDQTELIIPSLNAMTRLKERQSLAAIENQSGTQVVKTIRRLSSQAAGMEEAAENVEPSKSSMLVVLLGIILVSTMVASVSYFKYRNRTRNLELLTSPGNDTLKRDESILVNFDIARYEKNINS